MRTAVSPIVLLGCVFVFSVVFSFELVKGNNNEVDEINELSRDEDNRDYEYKLNEGYYVDLMWEYFFYNVFAMGELQPYNLRKLYGCDQERISQDGICTSSDEPFTATTSDQQCVIDVDVDVDASTKTLDSSIPTEDTWRLFEEAFYWASNLDTTASSTSTQTNSNNDNNNIHNNAFPPSRGMKIPHQIRIHPIIGRTIHNTEFVPRGTILWTDSHTAAFTSQNGTYEDTNRTREIEVLSYRRFIEYLYQNYTDRHQSPDAHNWACDAFLWTWNPQQVEEDEEGNLVGSPTLCTTFDMGNIFNDAEGTPEGNVDAEYVLDGGGGGGAYQDGLSETVSIFPGRTRSNCLYAAMRAARDIQPGEGMIWFGLVWFGLVWFASLWFASLWFAVLVSNNFELVSSKIHLCPS